MGVHFSERFFHVLLFLVYSCGLCTSAGAFLTSNRIFSVFSALAFLVALVLHKVTHSRHHLPHSTKAQADNKPLDKRTDISAHFSGIKHHIDNAVQSKLQVIPILNEQLKAVISQTDEAAGQLISAFMGISRQAKNQLKATKGLFGSLSDHSIDGNILYETQGNLKEIQSNFSTVTSFFDNVLTLINEVVEQLKKVNSFAVNIENIGKMTNILALNAAIEAAHSGAASSGFKVIATEINTLAKNSRSSIKEITDITEDLSSKVNLIKQKLESVHQHSMTISQRTDSLFGQTTQKISSALQDTASKIDEIANDADILTKEINNIVVSIQFQDITRQRIEHVITPLETLNKELTAAIRDIENNDLNIHSISNKLSTNTLLQQYTMESEREIVKRVQGSSTN
jgi:methyl-accepting chemotaxis protein